jgi:hypothetical protein
MKVVKIVVGVLLLFGASAEYINASKHFYSFFVPAILLANLTLILISTWLIGSSVSQDKFKIASLNFAKYFVICLFCFLVLALINLLKFRHEPIIVKIDGKNVNIAEFMHDTKQLIPDEKQREEYCICMITKLVEDEELYKKYERNFQTGRFNRVIEEVKRSSEFAKYNFSDCLTNVTSVNWTPTFEKSLRINVKIGLKNISKDLNYDLDKYSDCLIEKFKKLPINEFCQPGFLDSPKGKELCVQCEKDCAL